MINCYVIGFDPSGSYHEGKGTTGWCLMFHGKLIKCGMISAKNYPNAMLYYQAHLDLLMNLKKEYDSNIELAMEDYTLYASKAKEQINSKMETCRLIGVIEYWCFQNGMPCKLQSAARVKKRWTDEILEHEGIELPKTHDERHARDAIRHAIHYTYFG